MIETYFKRVKFTSLFNKNKDGSFSPRQTLAILGIGGNFTPTDKIRNLSLVDGSSIHEHEKGTMSVRKLGPLFMIMNFCQQ